MATPIIMPKQGQSVESCILTAWFKEAGEYVEAGDLLFAYETDKTAFDEEAAVSGILLERFFEEGDEVPVLTTIAVIGEAGEDTSEFNPHAGQPEAAKEQAPAPAAEPVQVAPAPAAVQLQGQARGQIKVSPRARRVAAELGVDYKHAAPTGAEGRVVSQDILALAAARPAEAAAPRLEQPEYREVEPSRQRKLIGERMAASASEVPRVTLNTSFDATEIMALRKKLKADQSETGLAGITLNDMVIYAVSRTLPGYPELNANLIDGKMRIFKNAHVGVAVDTERGLMVPTLFDANRKSLLESSREVKSMIQQCYDGNINPDYLQGGTFTVTNLGSLGIESFSPIINLPQTGILGVNTIEWKIKQKDGEFIHYPAMGLSLTFDHRAVDGAYGARFLQELTAQLEAFSLLLCV
ncbi:MAG: 2-oxo acid dehydrogenase subunit E2 [Firmicutes bacterium]|nr:2-oxo acid dehydrogenase subunit E2 [Bacillota bacterium]